MGTETSSANDKSGLQELPPTPITVAMCCLLAPQPYLTSPQTQVLTQWYGTTPRPLPCLALLSPSWCGPYHEANHPESM